MNEQQTIKFVLEVEKYPCLYNTTLSSYTRKTKTDKAWEEIGNTMKMSGAACKEKWRNLRIVYRRHLKPRSKGNKKIKPYYLIEYMHFLLPHIKLLTAPEQGNLASTSSTNETDALSETGDDSIQSDSSIKRFSANAEDNANNQSLANPRRKILPAHETDEHLVDYLKKESVHFNEAQSYNDAVTSFLISLAPEVREMNLQQFKTFKRRVLTLIDDILC